METDPLITQQVMEYAAMHGCWALIDYKSPSEATVYLGDYDFRCHATISKRRDENFAFFSDLFVHPEHRRQGIGDTCLHLAEEIARRFLHVPFVELSVGRRLQDLQAWYARKGYKHLSFDGDLTYMIKKL